MPRRGTRQAGARAVGDYVIQSPAAVGGAVYASTATHLAAVDATSGSVLWTRALPSGYVLACAAATGQPRWSVRTGSYVSPLAAADGRVIAGGRTVQAFAEACGAVAWTGSVHGAIAVTIKIGRASCRERV